MGRFTTVLVSERTLQKQTSFQNVNLETAHPVQRSEGVSHYVHSSTRLLRSTGVMISFARYPSEGKLALTL